MTALEYILVFILRINIYQISFCFELNFTFDNSLCMLLLLPSAEPSGTNLEQNTLSKQGKMLIYHLALQFKLLKVQNFAKFTSLEDASKYRNRMTSNGPE